jgi:multimeric flavodoxin WrbA
VKIIIINGSPRKNGTTGVLCKRIYEILSKKDDVNIEFINLSDYKIEYCTGCRVCYKTGKCVIKKDGVEELSQRVKNADGIILGSSTFGSYLTGLLKSFMDRGHFIVEQSLFNKYGFSLVTHEIAEGNKALDAIRKFFLVSGAIRSGELLVKLNYTEDPFRVQKSLEKRLMKKMDAFFKNVKNKKKRSIFEFIFTKIILVPVIWKPLFLKRKNEFQGILEIWKSKQII